MLRCTGKQLIQMFCSEYFNDKIVSDWFRKKAAKIQDTKGTVTLREMTEPVESETDDLIAELAVLADQPAHKTQSLLRHTDDKVFIALVMRFFIVTEYFEKHPDTELPYSEYLPQFIIDYLTNHWRLIKEQPDV